jgi:hypothetical protein
MEGTVEGFEVRARELLAPFDGVRVDLHGNRCTRLAVLSFTWATAVGEAPSAGFRIANGEQELG